MLGAAGILAAGATALTGLSDWTVSNDQDRRVGLFHGLLNMVALGLQGVSLGTRVRPATGARHALRARPASRSRRRPVTSAVIWYSPKV